MELPGTTFYRLLANCGKSLNFGDKRVNKSNFYKNKKLFKIDDKDVNKILVSKKEPYGKTNSFKDFIGYNDNGDIRPLCIKLPQMIGYAKYFQSNKTMSFKVSDKKTVKKISRLISKEFDNEPIYGDNGKQ